MRIQIPANKTPFADEKNSRNTTPATTPKPQRPASVPVTPATGRSMDTTNDKISKVKSQLQLTISNDRKINRSSSGRDFPTSTDDGDESENSEDDNSSEESKKKKKKEEKPIEISTRKPSIARRTSTVRFSKILSESSLPNFPSGSSPGTPVAATPSSKSGAATPVSGENTPSLSVATSKGGMKKRTNIAIMANDSDDMQRKASILHSDATAVLDKEKDKDKIILKLPYNPKIIKGYLLRHTLLLAPVAGKFIVRPHATRGFRLWLVRRSNFKKIAKILDLWAEGNIECLNVQDFIDIFLSLVPKSDRDTYRIMRNITTSLNRAGIKLIMELNSEILTRILENILEMKIISG